MSKLPLPLPHQWMILGVDREACPACMWTTFSGVLTSVGKGEHLEEPVAWQMAVITRWLASYWVYPFRVPLYFISVFALWLGADKHLDEDHNRRQPLPVVPPPVVPPPVVPPPVVPPPVDVPVPSLVPEPDWSWSIPGVDALAPPSEPEPDIDKLLASMSRFSVQNPELFKRFAEKFAERYVIGKNGGTM